MVQAQVQAYEMDEKELPATIQELADKEYLNENQLKCQNGDEIVISADGVVSSESPSS